MGPPGGADGGPGGESDERRLEKGRVLFVAQAAHQVRLLREVAEIVVESAGAGIGPVDDGIELLEAVGFVGNGAQLGEFLLEPHAVVEGVVEGVEVGAAIHRDGLVARDAQLHADALEQRFGQLEDAGAPGLGNADRWRRGRGWLPRGSWPATAPSARALRSSRMAWSSSPVS